MKFLWPLAALSLVSAITPILSDIRASQDNEILQLIETVESTERSAQEKSTALFEMGTKYLYGNSTVERNVSRAMHCFNQSASFGNPQAQYMWGLAHSSGVWSSVQRNEAVALLNYYFASLGGDISAIMSLASRHKNGVGVPKSCETALLYYEVAANKAIELREAESVTPILYDERPYRLSELIEKSKGKRGPVNEEVVDYYHYSAEKGDRNAMLSLATLYYYGARGLIQDLPKAAEYFQKAWDLGAISAGAQLGHIFTNGLGVEKDYDMALQYYQEASHEGTAAAQNGLGVMFLNGYGVEKNMLKAKKLFKSAAQQGYAEAFYNLGVISMGTYGDEPDYAAAAENFQIAAQRSHTLAMHKIGIMHLRGIGKERSCRMAVEYFKGVSERGPWIKNMWIARRNFLRGNYDLALALYLSLAEQGYEIAQHNAAWMVDKGYGYRESDHGVISVSLYKNAAKQGNVEANLKIGDFFYYGRGGVTVDYEKAIAHYRRASKKQNAQAMFNLGVMQEHGVGLPQDFHLAKRWYDMSATASTESKVPTMLALWKLKAHMTLVQWYRRWKIWSGQISNELDEVEPSTSSEPPISSPPEKKIEPPTDETIPDTDWIQLIGTDNVVLTVLFGLLGLLLYVRNNRVR